MAYMLSYDLPYSRMGEGAPKNTEEIREIVATAKLDFETIENEALNAYLSRIFHLCPLSEDICMKERCMDCAVFKKSTKK